MAIKPEENQSDQYCTLLQSIFLYSNNNRVLKLRHVSSGDYVTYFGGSGYCCGLLSSATDKYNGNYDVFTFIDWKSVVMLPNLIRIKGDNGNHLKAFQDGFMDYNFEADNSSLFDYEVFPSRNGGIRLKSTHFGTYWMDMDESCWVLLKQASTTVHETNTVFLPTILEGNRIMMRSLKNSYFCNRYNGQDKWSCLATLANYPDKWSSMDIEEPVISRKIDNIVYHLTDARVYNEKTLAFITDDSSNYTEETITSQLNLKTTVINTTNWSNSVTLKVGVKMSYTAGIPSISSGKFEISTEATGSRNWGQTDTESKEVGSVKTVTVKPMSRVKASLMATRLSYDIPFSYTQYDVLMNGTTKVSEKNDGIFTGQNG
ncbi:uncharacterized protein LOC113316823 [Papaver somniferum]|uniref:uncharacterized protein LOC113316823 n=1 Tax=Papaver somniferum TaxID=3469 RepID=UPI000E6FD978|nr:uncharacterized protein LOC113316823 [Papaver somniferum]